MSHSLRLLAFALASVALLAGVAACGDGGGSPPSPTATFGQPTPGYTPIATASGVPNESGQAPIFWRTADDFASIIANQPYTVLFRITNGYNGPSIDVEGTCTSCAGGRQTVTFEGLNSPPFPAGSDLPGSYYPMNIVLPAEGQWELTVQAGADQVTIPVDVKADP